jgi:hypothetical protein
LKAARGAVSASGATSFASPRGGRPLVIVKAMPAARSRRTASIVRSVRGLALRHEGPVDVRDEQLDH